MDTDAGQPRPGAARTVRRQFVSSGSMLALALFVGGFQSLMFFWALGTHPLPVTAVYGAVLTALTVLVVASGGFAVLVVSCCRGDTLTDSRQRAAAQDLLGPVAASVLMACLALAGVLLAFGLVLEWTDARVLPGSLPAELVTAFVWARLPSVALLPATSFLRGVLVGAALERVALRNAVENLALTAALAAALRSADLGPVGALVAVGLFGALVDLFVLVRLWRRLGAARATVTAVVRQGARLAWQQPVSSLARIPRASVGAVDAVVVTTAFAVIAALALGVSPEAEATTTALIALHRTIIVPLKSYGMVAGRLTRDDSHGASLSREQRMRVCATTVAYVVVPIGIVFLLAPQIPASVLGAAGDAPGALTAIRWVGVGFMLAPVSGFLGSALKILVSPGVDVRPLFVSLWVLTVPTLGILLALDALTVERIWLVLVASRVVQCGLVLHVYRRWIRAGETKPHLR